MLFLRHSEQSDRFEYFTLVFYLFLIFDMKKIAFRLVYNRKKQLNGEGKALIQIEAYLEKQKIYFSSHIYIKPINWDAKRKMVVGHPHQAELNRQLHEFILDLEYKELELWKQGVPLSLKNFKSHISQQKTGKSAFLTESRKWVEKSNRKESTKKNLQTTIELLERHFPTLTFQELDYSFLSGLEELLRKREYNVNTIAKHLRQLKTLVNEAVRRGYMLQSPFIHYSIKTVESRHTFLLPQEVDALEQLYPRLSSEKHRHALDAFLFCCYTGLRYSDFIQLSSANIIQLEKELWLVFQSKKTAVETKLPLLWLFQGKALKILHRYADKDSFFRLAPNSIINKVLIKLGKSAGIQKHFSFHTARHTNATLLIYSGANITTVQKLLGHKNIKTTQIYSEIFPESIVEDLKKCRFSTNTKE